MRLSSFKRVVENRRFNIVDYRLQAQKLKDQSPRSQRLKTQKLKIKDPVLQKLVELPHAKDQKPERDTSSLRIIDESWSG